MSRIRQEWGLVLVVVGVWSQEVGEDEVLGIWLVEVALDLWAEKWG